MLAVHCYYTAYVSLVISLHSLCDGGNCLEYGVRAVPHSSIMPCVRTAGVQATVSANEPCVLFHYHRINSALCTDTTNILVIIYFLLMLADSSC